MTFKSTKTLNFIKWNLCNCSPQTKSKAYLSLARPILEYASYTWDSHYNNHIISIEKIQRWALHWIFNDYNYSHSVTTMLQNLSWPTFQYHRKWMHLSLLYKSINHLTTLKIPNYFTHIYTSTRIHHQRSNFTNIRTNSYMNSYFPRTIREWNALPLNIIKSPSLNLFQHQLDFISNNH